MAGRCNQALCIEGAEQRTKLSESVRRPPSIGFQGLVRISRGDVRRLQGWLLRGCRDNGGKDEFDRHSELHQVADGAAGPAPDGHCGRIDGQHQVFENGLRPNNHNETSTTRGANARLISVTALGELFLCAALSPPQGM